MMTVDGNDPTEENAIVAFFEALSPSARREYLALAELDRRFGEDVASERAARAPEEKL